MQSVKSVLCKNKRNYLFARMSSICPAKNLAEKVHLIILKTKLNFVSSPLCPYMETNINSTREIYALQRILDIKLKFLLKNRNQLINCHLKNTFLCSVSPNNVKESESAIKPWLLTVTVHRNIQQIPLIKIVCFKSSKKSSACWC